MQSNTVTVTTATSHCPRPRVLPDWRTLFRVTEAELARYDLAELTLACAVGLPGAEAID